MSHSFGKAHGLAGDAASFSPGAASRGARRREALWSLARVLNPNRGESRRKQESERATYCMAEKRGEGAGQEPPVRPGPRPTARWQPCPTAGKPDRSLHPSALGEESTERAGEYLLPLSTAATKSPPRKDPRSHRAPSTLERRLPNFGFSGTSLSCNLTLSDRILASALLPNVAHSISLIYP